MLRNDKTVHKEEVGSWKVMKEMLLLRKKHPLGADIYFPFVWAFPHLFIIFINVH